MKVEEVEVLLYPRLRVSVEENRKEEKVIGLFSLL
jgi:hypothetical protein